MKQDINVVLTNHNFLHEIRALIKQFFPGRKIIFIKEKALVENQSLLIENILKVDDKTDEKWAITRVYERDSLMLEKETLIDDIDIRVSDEKRITKLGIKKCIYSALRLVSEVEVPWGVLTGIRPTKVVHELLDLGVEYETINSILKQEYLLYKDKRKLLLEIAKRERRFIYPLDDNSYSLYIGIPFCPSRCLYCSFPSNDIKHFKALVDDYVEKLVFELKAMSETMREKKLDTVYIGGGTPTALSVTQLKVIIETVYECFGEGMREFTVEAGRPDTIDRQKLDMLKLLGIERISINPQTMNDDTLKMIGRDHTVEDIKEVFMLSREIGFKCINMDIILGLPGEGIKELRNTLDEIKKLKPENLTVHTMSLKRAADISRDLDSIDLTEQKLIEEMIELTKTFAEEENLNPYYMYRQGQILGNFENVGYGKEGYECIYNMLIMEEKQTIIAVGAGATSKIYESDTRRVKRVPNVKGLRDYIDRVDEMIEKKRRELNAYKGTKRN